MIEEDAEKVSCPVWTLTTNYFGTGNDGGAISGEDHGKEKTMAKRTTLACDTAVLCSPQRKNFCSLPTPVTIEEDVEKQSGLGHVT